MWIKICGITSVEDAAAVVACGPDAVGLNFYAGSRRRVSADIAQRIVAQLPSSVEPVGVFVNHSAGEIRSVCRQCGLQVIQLHGDEPPELAQELEEFEILRAIRIGQRGLSEVEQTLHSYRELGIPLRGCLADADVAGAFGGTGVQLPWDTLSQRWKPEWPPLILAGGLTPANVADAISAVRPWGVDVASGVERSPGRKDPAAVQNFIAAAREAAGKTP